MLKWRWSEHINVNLSESRIIREKENIKENIIIHKYCGISGKVVINSFLKILRNSHWRLWTWLYEKLRSGNKQTWKLTHIPNLSPARFFPSRRPQTSECQIDASWHLGDSLSGHGWILIDQDCILHLGLKSSRRSFSPLQAEVDYLLWTMECMISLGDISCVFASDCSDMISLLDNQDEWPTFVAELASFRSFICFFPYFSIRFLLRSLNTREDILAKKNSDSQ